MKRNKGVKTGRILFCMGGSLMVKAEVLRLSKDWMLKAMQRRMKLANVFLNEAPGLPE